MKIEFDWKKFKESKPDEKAKIIFKLIKNGKPQIYIGEYMGILNSPQTLFVFTGGKIMTNSLAKKNNQVFNLTIAECEDVEWDLYNENWI
jgi:hypothetical protein